MTLTQVLREVGLLSRLEKTLGLRKNDQYELADRVVPYIDVLEAQWEVSPYHDGLGTIASNNGHAVITSALGADGVLFGQIGGFLENAKDYYCWLDAISATVRSGGGSDRNVDFFSLGSDAGSLRVAVGDRVKNANTVLVVTPRILIRCGVQLNVHFTGGTADGSVDVQVFGRYYKRR